MKRSIRTQLTLLQILLMVGAFAVLTLLVYFFLGGIYQQEKVNMIMRIYENLNEDTTSEDEDFSSTVKALSAESNATILVTDSEFKPLASTSAEDDDLGMRLFGYYTDFFNEGRDVIRKEDNYTLQISNDKMLGLQFLEMWGQLDNGDWCLIRTPMESMEAAARISVLFFVLVGAVVIGISAVVIWFISRKFTKPIVQLTDISKRMAGQDFSVRYSGGIQNEIGELGQNFNVMADELEKSISDLKTANVELQKDVEKRQKVDEVRKEFLNNVSHELKTPIALIQGYAEGLKDTIADDPESMDYYCDVIIDESAKMNTMVKKLLTLNQLEFGNDPVQMERFDLTQLIRGVAQGMGLLISQKGANLSFTEEEPVWVWGDEFKIEEVVTNYLSNALNHLDGEHKIEIRITREENLVRTSVFNTGHPIPEEDLPKIWDKFYKVDKARTREYGGSGIGLSIVKAIMDGHGQKCGVENYANGVAFWFTLEGK